MKTPSTAGNSLSSRAGTRSSGAGTRAGTVGALTLMLLAACSPDSDTTTVEASGSDTESASSSASSDPGAATSSPSSYVEAATADSAEGTAPAGLLAASGLLTVQDDVVPASEGLLVWGTPMLEGADIEVFDQDGYNVLVLPSSCRLTTYQGVYLDPGQGGSDAEGSERVRETLLGGYDAATELQSEPIEPVSVPVTGSQAEVELSGMSVTFKAEGKDWVDTVYYRGMPTADATLFMGMSCEQQVVDAGDSEADEILDQVTLNLV